MITKRALQLGIAAGLLVGAYSYISFAQDEATLSKKAAEIAGAKTTAADRTLALLDWVHDIGQTRENDRYFVWPGLRATPVQVMESGGDCADKSRLLTALLRHVGVASTMVMCFDPRTSLSTHTVVCAFLEDASTLVVDPAYGLYFPLGDLGRFAGLAELRRNPKILDERVLALRAELPKKHPVQVYNLTTAGYSQASSLNWNRDGLMRKLHAVLHPSWGEELYSLPRPLFLEEPKLFVACVGMAFSLGLLVVQAMVLRIRRLRTACVLTRARRRGPGSILTAKSVPIRAVGI
jgi:hypothetical protein